MRFKELAEYCKERKATCWGCEHKEECSSFSDDIENASPWGILSIIKEDKDYEKDR